MTEVSSGYVPVKGVQMYWESRGSGDTPLVLVHGGYGSATTLPC
jgi:pimeloyl-ACP methyl ester carboxylesterase